MGLVIRQHKTNITRGQDIFYPNCDFDKVYVLTQAGRLHKVIVYLVYCFMTSAYDSSSMYDSVIMSSIYGIEKKGDIREGHDGHSSYIYNSTQQFESVCAKVST